MSEPYIGQITMFAGNFPIRGFAFCHGQTLNISQNTALFSILGTTYGGDGRTTFDLPDLRGRIAMQQGQGPGLPNVTLGQRGGAYEQSLTNPNQLPAHSHVVTPQCHEDEGGSDDPVGGFMSTAGENLYNSSASENMGVANCSSVGASSPFNIQNPFLGINFLIALVGVFPPRN